MFRRYRKRREDADARKALMENQNYDVFDYEGEEVEIINENKHYVKQTKPHIPRRF